MFRYVALKTGLCLTAINMESKTFLSASTERDAMPNLRDRLLGETQTLLHWRDRLLGESKTLLRWRDRLLGESKTLLQWRDRLLGESKTLLKWRDRWVYSINCVKAFRYVALKAGL